MKSKLLVSFTFIIVIQLTSCSNMNNEDIKTYTWRYSDGFHIGDILELDNKNLRGDTIYSKNKPVAIIIKRSKETPFITSSMEIKDFNSDETGTYHKISYKN